MSGFIRPIVYDFRSEGSTRLPVTDGSFTTELMDDHFSTAEWVIAFYDATGTIVTPTAGTITIKGAAIEQQWLDPSSGDAEIDATLTGADGTYTIPVGLGIMRYGKITLADIAGDATYCKAFVWRA